MDRTTLNAIARINGHPEPGAWADAVLAEVAQLDATLAAPAPTPAPAPANPAAPAA